MKVRLFAMVDVFTQWILKPIHDYIFDILRGIETDATFNQHAAVRRIQKHLKKR